MIRISGIVDRANAPMDTPKSPPVRAIPPHGPDSTTVTISLEYPALERIDETSAGIPTPRLSKIVFPFFFLSDTSASAILFAIIL